MTTMKGVRKTTKNRRVGIRIGRHVLPPQTVIAGLLSLLYVIFIVGGSYEGRDIIIQLVYFGLFGIMIFVLGAPPALLYQDGFGIPRGGDPSHAMGSNRLSRLLASFA